MAGPSIIAALPANVDAEHDSESVRLGDSRQFRTFSGFRVEMLGYKGLKNSLDAAWSRVLGGWRGSSLAWSIDSRSLIFILLCVYFAISVRYRMKGVVCVFETHYLWSDMQDFGEDASTYSALP